VFVKSIYIAHEKVEKTLRAVVASDVCVRTSEMTGMGRRGRSSVERSFYSRGSAAEKLLSPNL